MTALGDIWAYLSATPLLGLTLTLVAYQGAFALYQRSGMYPLLNPVLVSVAALVALLTLTGTPYPRYFDGAQFIHFLLGPATVALAVPLHAQLPKLRRMLVPLLVALGVGSVTAALSAVAVGRLLGATQGTLLSLAPKSVTAPIAMGVSERIGGLPSLTAVLVILTGILGAVLARGVLDLVRVRDLGVRGFATGLTSHGIGTARAFQASDEAGAFAGLAMGLNGAATPLLVPALMRLLGMF